MIRPKISIITVVYNILEHRRKDCFIKMLDSIKSQNYGNIEHIVIDGNSNDGTKEFLKSLGVKFFSKKDNGIYDAMNNGIKKATGKYITFLNSDDYYFDETVSKYSLNENSKIDNELLKEYNIEVTPFTINLGGDTYFTIDIYHIETIFYTTCLN